MLERTRVTDYDVRHCTGCHVLKHEQTYKRDSEFRYPGNKKWIKNKRMDFATYIRELDHRYLIINIITPCLLKQDSSGCLICFRS